MFFLCANVDAQVVTTWKGACDYVCKYITKYGAGQSVNARVASLIDDIITRIPENKTKTVASIMARGHGGARHALVTRGVARSFGAEADRLLKGVRFAQPGHGAKACCLPLSKCQLQTQEEGGK